jgi:hypothetical protein
MRGAIQTYGFLLSFPSRLGLPGIDIEGTEQELLGRNNSWLKHVDAIAMEIHPNTTDDEIGGFLASYGLHLRRCTF